MKKTIFTFCSIAAVCCAIFFACAKDDNSITHVTYASQTSSNGTGGNPNPNGLPATSGTGVTTPATTGSTTSATITPVVNSVTLTTSSGPATGTITNQSCNSTYMS